MYEFIPSGPHEITAEWLTTALRKRGYIDQATVQSVGISNLGNDQELRETWSAWPCLMIMMKTTLHIH